MARTALARTRLSKGDRVLFPDGVSIVSGVSAQGVRLQRSGGPESVVDFTAIDECRSVTDGAVAMVAASLRPLWESLPDRVREATELKLEIVLEVVTGYRDGHHGLARPGEPRHPFGPSFGVSETRRCESMASILAAEFEFDRRAQRMRAFGENLGSPPSAGVIRRWARMWKDEGLVGLIDGRAIREKVGKDGIDPNYRATAETMTRALDGDRSAISIDELNRRVCALLRQEGIEYTEPPQRARARYLSWLMSTRGTKTRTQKTRALQMVSGVRHYPAMRPGQVVAIDATRADCLVRDSKSGEPLSVEVLTAIDVATRVILALRVVPKSADAIDAGLLLYDVCRPFSMLVDGTEVSDWRWCGLPGQIQLPMTPLGRTTVLPDFSTLQGDHAIPAVMPDAIRSDHGANFMSAHFQDLLGRLGIDYLPSRGRRPTDNPHVERWHETLQRAWQQVPGYKGRNPGERGAKVASEALLSPRQLELHLRKFVSLDYHRTHHSGLHAAGDPTARLTPLEMWDVLSEITGRIDVPQQPDLIFDFLPIHWAKIRHDGVTIANLVYDAHCLSKYRAVASGTFRAVDAKAPFYRDLHDLSRIWFRDPATGRIREVPWRGAELVEAPMTEMIVDEVWKRVRRRGGDKPVTSEWTQKLILDELIELTSHPERFAQPARLRTARLRREQSRRDLREGHVNIDESTARREAGTVGPQLDFDQGWGQLTDAESW